ncbi:MAG: ABC transporter substrate binding protein [Pseudomonadota bacterium]
MKKVVVCLSVLCILAMCIAASAADLSGKKVLFIDSYHEGYAWSDGITEGIQSTLAGTGAELKVHRMDTKRNGSDEFKTAAAEKAKAVIESYKPDVVIAADDNASKYLVEKYYKNAALPFVFCGVNWDATIYGYPYKNATGMVEVTPIPQLLEQLKLYAKGDKVGFLGPDTLTAKKEVENYKTVFGLDVKAFYATSFEDWEKGFQEMQSTVDMLIIESDGGLYAEHAAQMKSFVETNTRIPTGSAYDFMAPYAMVNFAKVASEQGAWAADAAIQILSGTSPAAIAIVQNKMGELIINTRIAKALGAEMPFDLLASANKVIE